jgi:hypothetical protein
MTMPINTKAVLDEIDSILKRYDEVEKQYAKRTTGAMSGDVIEFLDAPVGVEGEIISLLQETINRLAPTKDYGRKSLEGIASNNESTLIRRLAGVLKALRSDYEAGRILTIQQRIHSDVFSDFLEMAEYLIEDEGLKDPAAVLAGSVLEEHLRKLCDKHSITLPPKATINPVNAELKRAGVYTTNESKQIDAWAGLRNSAAHGKRDEYSGEQVKLMIQGIRLFLSSYPA